MWEWILSGIAAILSVILWTSWKDIQAYKKTKGDISEALHIHQRYIFSANVAQEEKNKEARERYRTLSAQLRAHEDRISFYRFVALMRLVPNSKDLKQATKSLTFLSNVGPAQQVPTEQIQKQIQLLRSSLGLTGSK